MRLKYPGTHWLHVLPIVRFLQLQSPTTTPSAATRLQSPLFLTPGRWHPHSVCREDTHSDGVPTTSQDNTMHLWRAGCKPSLSQTHPPPPTSSHTDMHLHTQYIRTYVCKHTHTHTSHTLVHTCIHIRMQIHQHIQLTNADIDISLPFGGVRIVERCTLLTLPPCSVVHAVDTDSPADSACSLVH